MTLRYRSKRSQRGSLIAELALSLPLFFTLIGGIGYFARPMLEYSSMLEAARIGARAGSSIKKQIMLEGTTVCDDAEAAAKLAIAETGRNPDDYTVKAAAVAYSSEVETGPENQLNGGGRIQHAAKVSTAIEVTISPIYRSVSADITSSRTARASFVHNGGNAIECNRVIVREFNQ